MSGQTPAVEEDKPFDPRASEKLPEGTVLAGRYTITEHLAAGGMGRVYVADQSPLGRKVALKVMHRELCKDEDSVKRFFREAVAVSQLTHPNTITIFDYGESSDGNFYIAMEYLEGEPLSERLKRVGSMIPEDAIAITIQVARSLSEAHRKGIIHRDLKPENVFLGTVEKDLVKVLDFGIAKILQQEHAGGTKLTRMGFVCGTPEYMSPEQARGEDLDGRSDLYALGVLLYEVLSGEAPFVESTPLATVLKHQNEDPPPLPNNIPEPLARFVLQRAMAKEAEDRPGEAVTFIEELELAAIQAGVLVDSTASMSALEMRRAAGVASSDGNPSIPDYGTATPPAMRATGGSRKFVIPVVLAILVVAAVVGFVLLGGEDDKTSTANAATSDGTDATGADNDGEKVDTAAAENIDGAVGPQPVTIKITSAPAGARIMENDVEIGLTPATIEAPEAGRRSFQLQLAGYASTEQTVMVPKASSDPVTLSVDAELHALLEIPVNSAPEGALVYVNDEAIGTTPISLALVPNQPNKLRFELDEYVVLTKEVFATDASEITVELEAEKKSGSSSRRKKRKQDAKEKKSGGTDKDKDKKDKGKKKGPYSAFD